jgi:RNA recognition motif-containing protein
MNIYVGNLPISMTEDDLRGIFAAYGEVSSAKIILDRETGRGRGFGFVDLTENAARKAISELNGTEYQGKQLTVNEALEKKQNFRGGDRDRSGGNRRY